MSDHANFETRLAAALERRADQAPSKVDAYAVTRAAAVAGSSAGARLFGVPGWRTARLVLTLALLALLVAASLVIGSHLMSPAPQLSLGRLVPAGQLTTPRGGPTATLLQDGRVLLVAGQVGGQDQSSAELYDPATNTFTRTGPISTLDRGAAAAAALPDGRVLIVGGGGQMTADADPIAFPFGEIYDPATGTFSRTGSMIQPRRWLWSAVTLPDGRVLIAGSEGDGGIYDSVELFDPATETFLDGGSLLAPRTQHTVTLLGDGRVLIAGGWSTDGPVTTAEIYDPATRTSVPTGDLGEARSGHTAAVLADGRVLIVGGTGPGVSYGEALVSAELYDPTKGTFAPTGSLTTERSGARSVTLRDGRVLVVGGYNLDGDPRTIELYDPASGTFDVAGSLAPAQGSGNSGWLSATLLDDGSVLLAGRDITTAERFVPTLPAEQVDTSAAPVAPVGFVAVDGPGVLRTGHTATRLVDGRILLAGGRVGGTGSPLTSAEVFDPVTGRSDPIGSMVAPRSGHAAALLKDGRILIVGGLREADPTISWTSAELYDPASGTFITAGVSTVAQPRESGPRSGSPDGNPAAVTLEDGRVLVVGWDPGSTEQRATSVRVYDPVAGTFLAIHAPSGLGTDAVVRSVTLLPDGRVLLLTGTHFEPTAQAHVYDPVAGAWTDARATVAGEAFSTTGLPDGRVLVAGGVSYHSDDGTMSAAWLWDPVTGTFSPSGDMAAARAGHAATLLPDGSVLMTGGFAYDREGGSSQDDPIGPERWDPRTGTFSPAGIMAAPRSGHTATMLDDGRMLLVGGVTRLPDRNVPDPPWAELYIGQ